MMAERAIVMRDRHHKRVPRANRNLGQYIKVDVGESEDHLQPNVFLDGVERIDQNFEWKMSEDRKVKLLSLKLGHAVAWWNQVRARRMQKGNDQGSRSRIRSLPQSFSFDGFGNFGLSFSSLGFGLF